MIERLKPSEALERNGEKARAILKAFGVRNPRLFGSVARGEDRIDSDLDILIDVPPRTGLMKLGGLQVKLEEALNCEVQLSFDRTPPTPFLERITPDLRPL